MIQSIIEKNDRCNHNKNSPYFKIATYYLSIIALEFEEIHVDVKKYSLLPQSITNYLPSQVHHGFDTMLTKCPQTHNFINN
jgi:hypothetical protein